MGRWTWMRQGAGQPGTAPGLAVAQAPAHARAHASTHALVLALALLAAAPCWALEGRVVRVTDGDSLWLRPAQGGKSLRVRIQGIDAPESCQAGGAAAKRALDALVAGRTVQLQDRGRDDHGRILGRLSGPGVADVGAALVAAGHAWSYRYQADPGPYVREEAAALKAKRGVHAQPGALLPREFRKKNGPCRVPSAK